MKKTLESRLEKCISINKSLQKELKKISYGDTLKLYQELHHKNRGLHAMTAEESYLLRHLENWLLYRIDVGY